MNMMLWSPHSLLVQTQFNLVVSRAVFFMKLITTRLSFLGQVIEEYLHSFKCTCLRQETTPFHSCWYLQYSPRNMHSVHALLCFVMVWSAKILLGYRIGSGTLYIKHYTNLKIARPYDIYFVICFFDWCDLTPCVAIMRLAKRLAYISRLTSVAFSYVNLFFVMLTRDHASTQTHPVITGCIPF